MGIKEYFKNKKAERLAYKQFVKDREIQSSEKPFFTMEALDIPEDGVKVQMDWNLAFIKQLREQGYDGLTDEQVIEGYLYKVFERAHMRTLLDPSGTRDASEA